jgi:hypothetical protein
MIMRDDFLHRMGIPQLNLVLICQDVARWEWVVSGAPA